jgi:hypothetical protein
MTTFIPFPKLARLSRGCVITEKLDGTNAAVIVTKLPKDPEPDGFSINIPLGCEGTLAGDMEAGDLYMVSAQSRTRLITPGKTTDNYGFAAWVAENADELVKLGVGHHYGEWYGHGIQRNYGLTEKRFALFNPERWPPQRVRPSCVSVVPVLWDGEFESARINAAMTWLKTFGSKAVPGFMDPEGVVVWHSASRVSFKKTFDDNHKEAA